MADRVESETSNGPDRAIDHGAARRTSDGGRGGDVLRFPSLGVRPRAPEPEPRLRTVIGDVLREVRHDQERTLADVADAAAVSLPYLSEVERGVKEVSSDVLAAICDALELELAEVLERSARRLRLRAGGGSGVSALAA